MGILRSAGGAGYGTGRVRMFGNERTGTSVRCQPVALRLGQNECLTSGPNTSTMEAMTDSQAPRPAARTAARGSGSSKITARQRQVLDFIEQQMRDRGYPPSVREIGEAIGLTSPSTVHSHLNTLQRLGYLRRDPTKPRAIEVRWDPNSGAVMDRRPVRHVPLVGDVAAGTDVLAEENVEELLPVPADFTGDGELFMVRVRGDSMIEAGILHGDYVIVAQQPTAAN